MTGARLGFLHVCALVLLPYVARAEDASSESVKTTRFSYWQDGAPRAFVSTRTEVGAYVKAQFAVGYGKPHWMWIGIEGYPITTTAFGAGYLGLRAALPFLDLNLGARYTYSYYRSFLAPKDVYVT